LCCVTPRTLQAAAKAIAVIKEEQRAYNVHMDAQISEVQAQIKSKQAEYISLLRARLDNLNPKA
jgi:hypothetical protein